MTPEVAIRLPSERKPPPDWGSLRALIVDYDATKLVKLVACFLDWNGENPALPPPPIVIQTIARESSTSGSLSPTGTVAIQAIHEVKRKLNEIGANRWTREDLGAIEDGPAEGWEEYFRLLSGGIFNPGTPGQMICYALDRFEPFQTEVETKLGFTIEECCLTVGWLQALTRLSSYRSLGAKHGYAERHSGPQTKEEPVLTPPAKYIREWIRGATFDGETAEWIQSLRGFNPKVVEFFTGNLPEFDPRRKSFGRFGLLSGPGDSPTLLIPEMIYDTMVSGVHQGLIERMSESEIGGYGQRLGDRFEELVIAAIQTRWTPEKIIPRFHPDKNRPDADIVVDFGGGPRILIECKGSALKPRARWSGIRSFIDAIRDNVVHGAEQAGEVLDRVTKELGPIDSVFIVLDAYFPGLSRMWKSYTPTNKAIKNLPHTVIITYYDLDYLTYRIRSDQIRDYLGWRIDLSSMPGAYFFDEYDVVNTFPHRDTLRKVLASDPGRGLSLIGHDTTFHDATRQTAVQRLGLPLTDEALVEEMLQSARTPAWAPSRYPAAL